MPPLSMFGRHWRISSDDFVCPALAEFVVRVSWIFILVFVFIFHIQEVEHLDCFDGGMDYQLTTYYLCISMGLLAATCLLNLLLAWHSARGRIVEHVSNDGERHPRACDTWHSARGRIVEHVSSDGERHPRACVPALLYLNIVFTVIEFIWTGVGAYFTIEDFIHCFDTDQERKVIVAVLFIIALFYLLLLVKIFLIVCSFRPYAKIRTGEQRSLLGSPEERRRRRKEEKLNFLGLRCIAPCTNDEDTITAFKDIAGILSKVFGDKDLVPSDILAGLILLSHIHNRDRGGLGQGVETRTIVETLGVSLIRVESENSPNTKNVCLELVAEDERIKLNWGLIKHYYKFAAAAYGYMWWVLQAPCTHCCKLGYYLQCCSSQCCEDQELFVEGDGVFKPNFAAIKAMLNVDDHDIIAFDNRNMIEEVPFLLVADKSTKSLIISIRGTLSLHDMLTDLRGEPGVILDSHPDWTGHQGMVNAAKYVMMRLHGQETEREMRTSHRNSRGGARNKDLLNTCLIDPEYEGYDIVVTGHSLGAGTATILAFLLRDSYPQTRVTCYAYSPPGGLLSLAASRESEKFTVSVVVGDDVIPRLSLTNIGALSRDIKNVISTCKLPKYQVFGYGFMACCCKRQNTPLMEELERLSNISSAGSNATGVLNDSSEELLSSPPSPPQNHVLLSAPPMFLPGRVIHIQEMSGEGYSVTEQDKFVFQKILVSTRMFNDHFPNNLNRVIDACPDTLSLLPVLV